MNEDTKEAKSLHEQKAEDQERKARWLHVLVAMLGLNQRSSNARPTGHLRNRRRAVDAMEAKAKRRDRRKKTRRGYGKIRRIMKRERGGTEPVTRAKR